MVLKVAAPSAIAFVGISLASVAGILLTKDPVEWGPLIMIGGTVVVVTAALGLILFQRSE